MVFVESKVCAGFDVDVDGLKSDPRMSGDEGEITWMRRVILGFGVDCGDCPSSEVFCDTRLEAARVRYLGLS